MFEMFRRSSDMIVLSVQVWSTATPDWIPNCDNETSRLVSRNAGGIIKALADPLLLGEYENYVQKARRVAWQQRAGQDGELDRVHHAANSPCPFVPRIPREVNELGNYVA